MLAALETKELHAAARNHDGLGNRTAFFQGAHPVTKAENELSSAQVDLNTQGSIKYAISPEYLRASKSR